MIIICNGRWEGKVNSRLLLWNFSSLKRFQFTAEINLIHHHYSYCGPTYEVLEDPGYDSDYKVNIQLFASFSTSISVLSVITTLSWSSLDRLEFMLKWAMIIFFVCFGYLLIYAPAKINCYMIFSKKAHFLMNVF